MFKLKSKLIIAVMVMFGITAFMSCEKKEIVENSNTVSNIESDFKQFLIDSEKKASEETNKTFSISYSKNIYDYEGAKHNEILDYLNKEGVLFNSNISIIMSKMTTSYGLEFKCKPDEFERRTNTIISNVYNRDNSYNSAYINSFNINNYEKAILNCYFNTMSRIQNTTVRIILSKYAENYIINSNLSKIEKKRILTAFAVYRYSTYYWNNINLNKSINDVSIPDLIDAICTYMAQNVEGEYEYMFQDGKDINMYASTMSATASSLMW